MCERNFEMYYNTPKLIVENKSEDFKNLFIDFEEKLIENSKELDPELAKILNEKFDELWGNMKND